MRVRFEREWNWWAINRPYVAHWWNEDGWGFAISWGNRNSDPAWSLGFEVRH